MKSFTRTLAAAILGAALAGIPASAQNVNVNFQNAAQFTAYHTYTFKNLYTTDALVEPRLAIAIDRNLQMRGWQEVAQGPDVLVTAVLASNNDPGLYKSFYYALNNLAWNAVGVDAPGDAPASVAYAPAGTLIVDNQRAGRGIRDAGRSVPGRVDADSVPGQVVESVVEALIQTRVVVACEHGCDEHISPLRHLLPSSHLEIAIDGDCEPGLNQGVGGVEVLKCVGMVGGEWSCILETDVDVLRRRRYPSERGPKNCCCERSRE